MCWTPDESIARTIGSLVCRIDLRYMGLGDRVARRRAPVLDGIELDLRLDTIGAGRREIGEASLEVRRWSADKLNEIREALVEIPSADSDQVRTEIRHQPDLRRTNPFGTEIRISDSEKSWSQLIERRRVESRADRRPRPQPWHDTEVRSNPIRRKPVVVGIVVHSATQGIRESLEWVAQNLRVISDVMARRIEGVGLGCWRTNITRPGGVVLVLLLVRSANGDGCVVGKKERPPALRVSAISTRLEPRVLGRCRSERHCDVVCDVRYVVAARQHASFNAVAELLSGVEADGESMLG